MCAMANRFLAALAGIVAVLLLPQQAAPQVQATSAGAGCAQAEGSIRRRPGRPLPAVRSCAETGLRPANLDAMPDFVAVPDRWRIVSALGYAERWWDPYNGNNVLKADRPAFGDDWFFQLSLISDSTFEARQIPTPVAIAASPAPGSLDIMGNMRQAAFTENLIVETVLYKGDTVFKPPDYEFRFIPVFNLTHAAVDEQGVLNVKPPSGTTRNDAFVGIQGLFVDKHLRNVSVRYDFDSLRIGIQPITADFRGFLFQDSPLGIRLFGTRANNLWQYNLAAFRRIEKDTNSGLNNLTDGALRDDDVFMMNLYRQDFPFVGFTSQVAYLYNRNRETDRDFVDDNGFLARPAALGLQQKRKYDVSYIGYNGDGHIGPLNLTVAAYYAFGRETPATFSALESDIRAGFVAVEASRDFDWVRAKATFVYASGDDDPYDDKSTGFDAIFENPLIAGADTSFWIRQAVPLIGGGRVALSGQNGLLNSMRSSKGQGQSNFTNPGLLLAGLGADLDFTPKLRLSINFNQLWFDDTAVLEAARNQGNIDENIGQDVSLSITYRPLTSQNIVMRLAASALVPGNGYKDLFGAAMPFSIFANLVLAY